MSTAKRFVNLLILASASLCGGAVFAAPDCSNVPVLTPLQHRIAASAGQGTDALRRFVAIRQMIYRYDVRATMERGMQHHDWLATCRGKLALQSHVQQPLLADPLDRFGAVGAGQ
jgi:hypothetical protein